MENAISEWDEWAPDCWVREAHNFSLDIGRDEQDSHIWTAALVLTFMWDPNGPQIQDDFSIFLQKRFDTLEEAKEWADWADLNAYRTDW